MAETQTAPAVTNETWQNATRGKVGVRRQNAAGEQSVELVRGGDEITLTKSERILTERKYRKPKNNPFRNGKLVPIVVDENDEDLKALLQSPNTITKGEIDALLDGNLRTMETRLKKIDALPALERILEVADSEGASTRRMQAIRDRIVAVKGPQAAAKAPEPTAGGREKFYPPEMGGVAPEGGAEARVG